MKEKVIELLEKQPVDIIEIWLNISKQEIIIENGHITGLVKKEVIT